MRKQFIQFIATGALAAGMAFAQASPAAPAPNGQYHTTPGTTQGQHQSFMQQRLARLSRELNLTDTQKAQARTIFGQARETAKPVREQLMQNRQALRAAVKANNSAEIEQLATARGNLMGKMLAIHSEAAAKFYQTLSPEQRVKADQLHQQFRERIHNWHSQPNIG
jgi:Spy/CpxP family protein refolding chaperone